MAGITLAALLVASTHALPAPQLGAIPGPGAIAADSDRLYGRVTTESGRVLEGYLRWDRTGASPADFLDAAKEIPRDVLAEAERLDPDFAEEMRERRSIVAFGVRVTWAEDDMAGPPRSPSAIRFGYLAFVEPLDHGSARLTLRDGRVVELLGGTADLGAATDVLVEIGGGETVEIDWDDIVRVDFVAPPPDAPAPGAYRLHGTTVTWSGLELTGWIAWDRDEVLSTDILDGREGATEFELPFAEIVRIAPEGPRSARVVLHSGVEHVLRGTNDVDDDNRGIEVADPTLGRAVVSWEDLQEVRFHASPGPRGSEAPERRATGSTSLGPLRGTVYARDGRVIEGQIRWGHEEEHGWEVLDGWIGDTRLEIELGLIGTIRPDGPDAAVVELYDGRTLRLEDTDDVGEGHRGVFVEPDGRTRRLVRWVDVERVELAR